MDYIERYVYAVSRNLPKAQRADIEKEIRAMIDDLVEQDSGPSGYEAKVQKVLLELGDPDLLADKYRGTGKYLIGPLYFNKYIQVLKVVLSVILCVSFAVLFVSLLFSQGTVAEKLAGYASAVFSMLVQGFAWTTIAFVIAERAESKSSKETGTEKWSPAKLLAIPDKKSSVSPIEPIISMIIAIGLAALIIIKPEIFAAYFFNDKGMTTIPIFNLDIIWSFNYIFALIALVNIFREALKLIMRKWNLKLAIPFSILTLISVGLVLVVLTNESIWNQTFIEQILQNIISADKAAKLSGLIDVLKNGIIAIVAVVGAIEIAEAMYKGIRFNKNGTIA